MLEDLALKISLAAGFVLFIYVMARIHKNEAAGEAMSSFGPPGAVLVFGICMTIALGPILLYEDFKLKGRSLSDVKENISHIVKIAKESL